MAPLVHRFTVHGVDAAPTLVSKLRERFPNAPVEYCSVKLCQQELAAHGRLLVGDDEDEGKNCYYFATKS